MVEALLFIEKVLLPPLLNFVLVVIVGNDMDAEVVSVVAVE